MSDVRININKQEFLASLLPKDAPKSVAQFKQFLPLEATVKHVRWSGYAVCIENFSNSSANLADLPSENSSTYPSCGDILLRPGHVGKSNILIACGPTALTSPLGSRSGNHLASIDDGKKRLSDLEIDILNNGAQNTTIRQI